MNTQSMTDISSSFARCLDLRDKYLALSHQRLGDNPRDHDGTFSGFYPRTAADTMGLKPDADPETCEQAPASASEGKQLPAWNIYPPPPPPHWHWKSAPDGPQVEFQKSSSRGGSGSGAQTPVGASRSDMYRFKFEDCEIPPAAQGAEFALNDEGVFEVFVNHDQLEIPDNDLPTSPGPTSAKGKQKIQHVPSLKEYFTDLDYLLGVCSDGPAKSFAFRRLKYLASKWSLYCLLNEYQELADMKVS
jgi:AMP deaminase